MPTAARRQPIVSGARGPIRSPSAAERPDNISISSVVASRAVPAARANYPDHLELQGDEEEVSEGRVDEQRDETDRGDRLGEDHAGRRHRRLVSPFGTYEESARNYAQGVGESVGVDQRIGDQSERQGPASDA